MFRVPSVPENFLFFLGSSLYTNGSKSLVGSKRCCIMDEAGRPLYQVSYTIYGLACLPTSTAWFANRTQSNLRFDSHQGTLNFG